jgi:hypothetical protein
MRMVVACAVAMLLAGAVVCRADNLCHDTAGGKDYHLVIEEYATMLNSGMSKDDMAAIYNNRGYAHYKEGLCDQAIVDYNRAIALNPILSMHTLTEVMLIATKACSTQQ